MGSSYSIVGSIGWYIDGVRHYGHNGFVHARKKFIPGETDVDLSGVQIVITGANSGLGKATTYILAQKNATIHMVCRSAERGNAALEEIRKSTANNNLHLHICDISEFDSVRQLSETLQNRLKKVDILINNAGVLPSERKENTQGVEVSLATMLGGTFLLTGLLRNLLKSSDRGARVINVSSGGMYTVGLNVDDLNLEDSSFDGAFAYSHNKRAQVVLSEMMAKKLRKDNIFVSSMHPGWADTPGVEKSLPNFYKRFKSKLRSPEEGADTIVWLCTAYLDLAQTGQFWFDRNVVSSAVTFSGTGTSVDDQIRLWSKCERLCGHAFDES